MTLFATAHCDDVERGDHGMRPEQTDRSWIVALDGLSRSTSASRHRRSGIDSAWQLSDRRNRRAAHVR
jgi:hypothetical protein